MATAIVTKGDCRTDSTYVIECDLNSIASYKLEENEILSLLKTVNYIVRKSFKRELQYNCQKRLLSYNGKTFILSVRYDLAYDIYGITIS